MTLKEAAQRAYREMGYSEEYIASASRFADMNAPNMGSGLVPLKEGQTLEEWIEEFKEHTKEILSMPPEEKLRLAMEIQERNRQRIESN